MPALDLIKYVVVNLWNRPEFDRWQMPGQIRVIGTQLGDQGALANGGDNIALFGAESSGSLIDGSLSAMYPDLTREGESIEKIDERFPWGDPDTVGYNFRCAMVPIGFETGLDDQLEYLSERASPGRENGTLFLAPVGPWPAY